MAKPLARYVYVYLEGGRRILTLCEVEVYSHQGSQMYSSHVYLSRCYDESNHDNDKIMIVQKYDNDYDYGKWYFS